MFIYVCKMWMHDFFYHGDITKINLQKNFI